MVATGWVVLSRHAMVETLCEDARDVAEKDPAAVPEEGNE